MEVKAGRANVVIVLLGLITCLLFAYFSVFEPEPKWGIFAGTVAFSFIALFALLRAIPGIGKPALVLNIQGFQTPLHGTIPWGDVGGINFQRVITRGIASNILSFQVENYAKAVVHIHWTEFVLNFFGLGVLKRKVIAVLLNGASEDPQIVAATAKLLWQQSTGLSHEWNPMLSNEYNQANRRVHDFLNHYKNPEESAADILKDPEKALKTLKELEQFSQDMEISGTELRRYTRMAAWLMAIAILGVVGVIFLFFI